MSHWTKMLKRELHNYVNKLHADIETLKTDLRYCRDDGAELVAQIERLDATVRSQKRYIDELEYDKYMDAPGDWVIVVKRDPAKVDNRQTHMCSRSFYSEKHAREYANQYYDMREHKVIYVGAREND